MIEFDEMLNIKIGTLRKLAGSKERWTFNVMIQTDNSSLIVNGLRIINGKIYSPAVQYKPKCYFSTNFFENEIVFAIYDELIEHISKDSLLSREEACKPLTISKTVMEMFMPDLVNLV